MKKPFLITLVFLMLTMSAVADYDMDSAATDARLDAAAVDTAVFEETSVNTDVISVSAPSAILIEKTTGTVIFEKNPDEKRLPASVTKVMSILLFAEAIDSGDMSLDDMVIISSYAASMGGSQVYLEENEQMTVHELLKCCIVVSANDATVALAEHLCGSEEAFVMQMNAKAKELGMTNSNFTNSTGLWDDETHVTTARDIALMSKELMKHEWVTDYTTIWMDTIRGGEFGLSNTNKLIYYYDGATGLKTGFTSKAGYCLAASAKRDGVEYIAVVLGCETSEDRFSSTKVMLNFAFANFDVFHAVPDSVIPPIAVELGKTEYVQPEISGQCDILIRKSSVGNITKNLQIAESIKAPVDAGTEIGSFIVSDGESVLAEIPIIINEKIDRLSWWDIFVLSLGTTFGII